MRDDEYTFGSKGSNFEDLIKKYQTISEEGEAVPTPVPEEKPAESEPVPEEMPAEPVLDSEEKPADPEPVPEEMPAEPVLVSEEKVFEPAFEFAPDDEFEESLDEAFESMNYFAPVSVDEDDEDGLDMDASNDNDSGSFVPVELENENGNVGGFAFDDDDDDDDDFDLEDLEDFDDDDDDDFDIEHFDIDDSQDFVPYIKDDDEISELSLFADESADEEEQPFEMNEEVEEPDFSYNLDMFGAAPSAFFDASSIDDSWLDSSLDESIFYEPEISANNIAESFAETSNESMPSYIPQTEPEDDFDSQYSSFIPAREPVKPDMTAVAGGYVAASNVDNFTFDADSGLDFGDDDNEFGGSSDEPMPLPQELEGLPVFAPATPDRKTGKLKAKKETKAMTGFSKNYKIGGDKGKEVKKGNWFTRNFVPSSNDPVSEKIRKIVMIISVIAVICSGGYLFNDYVIMPYLNQKNIDELQNMISNSSGVINEQTMEQKYPGVNFPSGMLVKYADLYARNQDFVGWIKIDGLGISLPVVRGENNSKYLKTDFDGRNNKYGSIFMNCTNSVDNLNYNTTLFGHYMKDEKMFGKLMDYKDARGYKKAPLIEFNTIYGDYKWKVFAVMITNGTSNEDNGYLFNYMLNDLSSNQTVEEFLGEVKLRSIYYPEVDIALSDKILTLSTCTYELDEGRLVIMARMVRPGESTEVNVDNIRYNPNPRYPQAYYDKKGLSNPYKSYPKWYPS